MDVEHHVEAGVFATQNGTERLKSASARTLVIGHWRRARSSPACGPITLPPSQVPSFGAACMPPGVQRVGDPRVIVSPQLERCAVSASSSVIEGCQPRDPAPLRPPWRPSPLGGAGLAPAGSTSRIYVFFNDYVYFMVVCVIWGGGSV